MNILIVDDHPMTCQGLAALLEATLPQARVRSVHTAAQAQLTLQEQPETDWIFLDINLPDDVHHHFFHGLCETNFIGRTVLISAAPDHVLIQTAMAEGARGFIPKTSPPDEILAGFAAIRAGEFHMPPEIALHFSCPPDDSAGSEPPRALSPRLVQVQEHLQCGTPNKLIARALNLSPHTVKEYVSSVLAFHGVANRLALVLKLSGEPRRPAPNPPES
jgi:two-component system nitrate/nitrite response regulator NarL